MLVEANGRLGKMIDLVGRFGERARLNWEAMCWLGDARVLLVNDDGAKSGAPTFALVVDVSVLL